ncbi:MAG: cyclase family protein [Nitrospirae bacterium]|nr:cyclase family protein [Nitrospirota bacterium]MBF0553586.1 cyclase family protein [Nitrospirota bacterium]
MPYLHLKPLWYPYRYIFESGKAIIDYSFDDLIFTKPFIVDCPKEEGEIIGIDDLKTAISPGQNIDLLIIRTGFYKYRSNDVLKYTQRNPYLMPETAQWLKNNLCISITSFSHREIGKDIHKILLGNSYGNSALIIEDICLTHEID